MLLHIKEKKKGLHSRGAKEIPENEENPHKTLSFGNYLVGVALVRRKPLGRGTYFNAGELL